MRNYILILGLAFCNVLIAQQEAYVQSADHAIFFKKFGEKGIPMLIINGGPGMNSRGFESVAQGIASLNCQAIIYDQRGTGKSTLPAVDSNTITMKNMVADIEALRQHFGFEKWVVLGHSFGGILANYYATLHPERVQGLIASSSGGVDLLLLEDFDITRNLTQVQRDSLAYYSAKIREGDTTAATSQKRLQFFAAAYVADDKYVEDLKPRMQQVNQSINRLVWQDLRSMNYDCKNQLKSFSAPVLIIQGQQDIIGLEVAQRANETFPNASMVLLNNCGHYGWLEQPQAYYAAISKFLEQLQS